MALLGACIGSFLNVCLYRWKNGGQVVSPSSFCPHCKKTILWFDNIPIVSFFLLMGKCRSCHRPISWQYPMVEFTTAFLFYLSSVKFLGQNTNLLFSSLVFSTFLILLVASDLKWWMLPHLFNNLFILTGLLFSPKPITDYPSIAFNSAANFVLLFIPFVALTLLFPNGFGGGDVKMVAGLSIWLGFNKSILVLFLSFVAGSFVILPLLILKKISLKTPIRFGPFLGLGSMGVWFWPDFFCRQIFSLTLG